MCSFGHCLLEFSAWNINRALEQLKDWRVLCCCSFLSRFPVKAFRKQYQERVHVIRGQVSCEVCWNPSLRGPVRCFFNVSLVRQMICRWWGNVSLNIVECCLPNQRWAKVLWEFLKHNFDSLNDWIWVSLKKNYLDNLFSSLIVWERIYLARKLHLKLPSPIFSQLRSACLLSLRIILYSFKA